MGATEGEMILMPLRIAKILGQTSRYKLLCPNTTSLGQAIPFNSMYGLCRFVGAAWIHHNLVPSVKKKTHSQRCKFTMLHVFAVYMLFFVAHCEPRNSIWTACCDKKKLSLIICAFFCNGKTARMPIDVNNIWTHGLKMNIRLNLLLMLFRESVPSARQCKHLALWDRVVLIMCYPDEVRTNACINGACFEIICQHVAQEGTLLFHVHFRTCPRELLLTCTSLVIRSSWCK